MQKPRIIVSFIIPTVYVFIINSAILQFNLFISTWATKVVQDFAMSEDLLNLVLQLKSNKSSIDMAKIQIKSEKLTPLRGIFAIMEQFDALLSKTIDFTLGLRSKVCGYQYSEIFRFLMCVYFCSGLCVEDVTTHLMKHLSLHPTLHTCSADNHTASYRGTDR